MCLRTSTAGRGAALQQLPRSTGSALQTEHCVLRIDMGFMLRIYPKRRTSYVYGGRIVVDMLVFYVQARIHFRRREALRSIMLPNCGCELNLASKQTWHSDFFCAIRNNTNSSLAEKLLFVQTHNMASCYQSQPHPPPSHGPRSTRAVSKSPYSFFFVH